MASKTLCVYILDSLNAYKENILVSLLVSIKRIEANKRTKHDNKQTEEDNKVYTLSVNVIMMYYCFVNFN